MNRREFVALAPAGLLAQTPTLDQFFDNFTADWMRANPEQATSARFFPAAEQDVLDAKLSPASAIEGPARVARAKQGLAGLAKFDRAKLTPAQRLSADIFHWLLTDIVEAAPFLDLNFPLNQFRGTQTAVTQLLTDTHPIRNRRDADNWLARFAAFPPLLDQESDTMRERAGRGIRPPTFILAETVAQMQRFIQPPPEQNIIVTSFAQRLKKAQVAGAETLVASANKIMAGALYPSYRRSLDNLATISAKATPEAGLRRLPKGLEAYAFYLHRYTTTNMTAEQIHQKGLAEVQRIEAEMESLLKPLGYKEGTVEARFKKLQADHVYPNSPNVRDQILADYTEMIRVANERSAADFDLRPKAPCIVQRIPEYQEANSAANYQTPPRDGSRPGIFRVPLPGPTFTKVGMRTLAYHEAIPGHHFQLALQVENSALPRFRQASPFGGLSAFTEGWGLYAERLASDLGWYKGDPVSDLGRLNAELFRARRLVTDTGLHTKGWTREQAIAYGIPKSEVDRYVVMPGQACSYKIGQLKMLELRERARTALGAKFTLKEFHNVMLSNGSIPLAILENVVNDWVKSSSPPR
ncbi:MAG: DUF885 domain-containing protein [Bryobacteraceae bacterium]|nr:DUF885 domain-containing protein [Bryobacteraceae bacterium]